MAVCVIVENPEGDAATYEKVLGHVAQSGEMPPRGAIFQVAGPAEQGWRVVTVWNSPEDFEAFSSERLAPAWAEVGVSREDVKMTSFEAHSFMAGDLSGASQPG